MSNEATRSIDVTSDNSPDDTLPQHIADWADLATDLQNAYGEELSHMALVFTHRKTGLAGFVACMAPDEEPKNPRTPVHITSGSIANVLKLIYQEVDLPRKANPSDVLAVFTDGKTVWTTGDPPA